MTMTDNHPSVLARSDAILRTLDAISSKNSSCVERLILEGIAYIAQQDPYRQAECRVLRAFDSQDRLLDFHESLAYLQEMGRVELIGGQYALTSSGQNRLDTIGPPSTRTKEDETDRIHKISETVRTGLDL